MTRTDATFACRRVSYEVWCQCARQLLGWAEDDAARWPALYLGGLTPLQAARQTCFGDTATEARVWL